MFADYSDLFGGAFSEGDLAQLLRGIPFETAARMLCKLLRWLERQTNEFSLELQLSLAEHFLRDAHPIAYARAVDVLRLGDRHVLFFPQQIFAVLDRAIKFCSDEDYNASEDDQYVPPIAEALIGITDHLYDRRSIENDVSGDRMWNSLAQNATFNHHERDRKMIGRWFTLLRSNAADLEHRDCHEASIFESLFSDATSVSLLEFWAVGTGLISGFDPKWNDPKDFRLAIQDADWFRDSMVSTAPLQLSINLITADREKYAELVKRQESVLGVSRAPFGFLPFYWCPLIRLKTGHLLLTSRHLLVKRLTEGVFWDIHEEARNADANEGVRTLMKEFGAAFEDYMRRLLEGMYPPGHGLSKRAVFLDDIDVPEGIQIADVCVIDPPFLVVVEFTATRFLARGMIGDDVHEFIRDFDRGIAAKAKQLESTINAIRSGQIDIGVDASAITDYIPVIATIEDYPAIGMIRGPFEHQLDKRGLLRAADARPLEIIDAEEWETLEVLVNAGRGLADIINSKNLGHEKTWRPLRNHFYELEVERDSGDFIQKAFDGWWKASLAILFGRTDSF